MIDDLHLLLAFIAAGVVIGGVAWSAALAFTGRSGGAAYVSFQAAVVAILLVAAASGLVLLVIGHGPTEGLHFIYAAIAIAIIPLARSFFGGARERRQVSLLLLTFMILGVLVFRLFASG